MSNTNIEKVPFYPADILIPKDGHDSWSVVACDQFTSQPEYWEELDAKVSDRASALRVILPEAYLSDRPEERTELINATMAQYLSEGVFEEYNDAMIYVERTLPDGRVRRGIVGAVDLEAYDYTVGSKALIRATEGTVLDRIPPRVKIRENAPIELPHIMLLIDDKEDSVISNAAKGGKTVYDFELCMGGGHLKGVLIDKEAQKELILALEALCDGEDPLLFAVGDGNHSLATAKACYGASNHPLARFALAEVVNIHDSALEFEPIYRVLFGVDEQELISEFEKRFASGKKKIDCLSSVRCTQGFTDGFTVYELQSFIDEYIASHKEASVDYIHGEDVVKKLASQSGAVGFIFDGIEKSELFPYIKEKGVLPRKTFSMGEAASKRYYMEARKIK